jgi:hypothetical protein
MSAGLIPSYNRRLLIAGVARVFASLVAYAIAYLFFDWALSFSGHRFGIGTLDHWSAAITLVLLALISVSGYRRWRNNEEHYGYQDSELFVPLDELESGGGYAIGTRVNQVTALAYMLGQIFLAAPLQLCRGVENFRKMIRATPELEDQLAKLIAEINSTRKWEPVAKYRDYLEPLALLINMDRIDFSRRKQTVKAK